MRFEGVFKSSLKVKVLFAVVLVLVAFGFLSYNQIPFVTPDSINKDPHPVALRTIPPISKSGQAASSQSVVNKKPASILGWSSDTSVDPASNTGQDAARASKQQQQTFPPKSSDTTATGGQAADQSHATPTSQQWSGTQTVRLPPNFQVNTNNKFRELTVTGMPTNIARVAEIRQKIATGEAYFQRPKTEKTPVQFQRDK